jgi:hypothetical protein
VDVTGKGDRDKEKKEGDTYAARNERTSELWRPGSGFKPTSFANPKGPKVRLLLQFVLLFCEWLLMQACWRKHAFVF